MLAIGFWLLAFGCWLLAVGFRSSDYQTTNNFEFQHATSEAIQPSISEATQLSTANWLIG